MPARPFRLQAGRLPYATGKDLIGANDRRQQPSRRGAFGYGETMTAPHPHGSDISVVYVIGRLDHGIRRDMRQLLAEWELSVSEFTALSILRRRPGLSNAQLARRTMVAPQSMLEILAALEARALVQRTVDPNHGRILRSELTPEGTRVLDAAECAIDAIQVQLLADVPYEERQIVLDWLLKAMQRLQPGSGRARR